MCRVNSTPTVLKSDIRFLSIQKPTCTGENILSSIIKIKIMADKLLASIKAKSDVPSECGPTDAPAETGGDRGGRSGTENCNGLWIRMV